MAHDIEKRIQQKVMAAEALPITWRKDAVWQKIARPESPSRVSIAYYAAAASLVVGVAILYSIGVIRQERYDDKIKSLELLIANKSNQGAKVPPVRVEMPCASFASIDIGMAGSRSAKRFVPERSGLNQPIVILPSEEAVTLEKVVASETPIVAEIKKEIEAVPAPVVVNTVTAIVGYIPPPRDPVVVSRKLRKTKLRLLKTADPETGESTWIVARIN